MTNRYVRAIFAVSLLCATAGASTLIWTAAAQAADKLSAAVGKPLSDAVKSAQAGDLAGALASVKIAQAVTDRTPFEDYKINSILAYIAINMKDYDTATTATEASADSPALPDEDKQKTYYNAVLLSSAAKHYQKAITYGQDLATLNGVDDKIEAQLAVDYYELKDMAHAQQTAQKAIDMAKAAGKPADPNSLRIVMQSEASQNNQAGAEQTLETLAVTQNDLPSWHSLIELALGTKGMKDVDAFYLFRLKLLIGAMQGDDYNTLAGVAAQLGYPTEAANVLQQGVTAGKVSSGGELLAKSRKDAAADERMLPAIAAQAEKSKTGEQDIKLAEDYWGYGRFADAEVAAHRAIAKGGMKDPAEGPLLLGALQVAQAKYADAIQTLGQVDGSAAKQKVAHLWSLYAQSKQPQAAAAPAPAPAPAK
jgi:hypothetical protein